MKNNIFPNKIVLLGEVYKIKEVSKYDLITEDEEVIGKLDWDKKTIFVSIDSEDNTPEEILFHELGHYFGYYYDVGKTEIFADSFANFIKLIIEQLGYKK